MYFGLLDCDSSAHKFLKSALVKNSFMVSMYKYFDFTENVKGTFLKAYDLVCKKKDVKSFLGQKHNVYLNIKIKMVS